MGIIFSKLFVMNNKLFLFIIFLNCSCTSLSSKIPDYVLIKNGTVIGSNSSVLLPSHQLEAKTEYKEGVLSIDYPILIKNADLEQVASIYLGKSVIQTNEVALPVMCKKVGGGASTIFVEPQQLVGVMCEIKLKPDAKNKLAMRDTRAILKIHVSTGMSPTLDFPVVLRMEDFNE